LDQFEPGSEPEDLAPATPAPALPMVWLSLILGLFTLGGVLFGLVFLRNLQVLIARPVAVGETLQAAPAPQPSITKSISSLPQEITSRVRASAPQLPSVPSLPSLDLNPLPAWSGTERVNILLLGIDKRPDEPVEGTRTDTIIVVSLDPVQHSAVMLSFPRDLWVSIPGYGQQRINVAHAVGGPELTVKTLEANFGLHIDYWARIDFDGFRKIVDTLGGVVVDVERPIKDDEYPTEDYGYKRIYIPAGPQLMDGQTALEYARSRHSENDFGRAHRQQRVLLAMRDRAMTLHMLPRVPALVSQAQSTVATDLSTSQIIGLARLAQDLDPSKVSSVVFDVRYADPFIGPDGANLLAPNRAAIERVLARVQAGQEPEPPRLEVLNGSTVQGLAARTADALRRDYEIARVAPADRTDYQQTEIVVLGSRHSSGVLLAQRLGLPASAVRDEPTPDADADLRLIVAGGFTLPGAR